MIVTGEASKLVWVTEMAPTLTSFAQWDLNSDGSINEEEFNTAVGKRKPVAHLKFDVSTYVYLPTDSASSGLSGFGF